VERVTERQKISSPTPLEEDVIALAEEGDRAYVEVFLIRSGRLIGREHFILEGSRDEEPGEIMSGFVKQFYDSAPYIPPLILLQHPVNEVELVEGWLGSRRGGRVELRVPHRGEKRKLMEMVAGNAREGLEQMKLEWMADSGKISAALEELRDKLDLPHLPLRMECYDISNIGGTSAVGSMVVFENGKSRVSHYRRFKIKTVAATDDCAMLREVLRRRFKRNAKHVSAPVSKSGEKTSVASETIWTIIPDLILIDGGKGQLNASLEALQEVGIEPVPIASLAKQNEEVFVPNRTQPIILPRSSPALFLLQRIRDEAHRFALSYHVKVRRKTMLTSNLDEIPGIGPRRKRALIKRFGSVRAIREASAEELAVVENMTRPAAERVKEYLQSGCSSSCS
jgi:excinuclease ABC subunit C